MTGAPESLRAQSRRLARERIVEAAAEEIVEHGLPQLAVPAVAKRAGVSLRTVYNYFETREALIAGIPELLNQRLQASSTFGEDFVFALDELPSYIPLVWREFAALGTLGDAWSVIQVDAAVSGGASTVGSNNEEVDALFFPAVARLMPDADEVERRAVARLIRTLFSSETFYRLRHQGIELDAAATSTSWAVGVLLEALRSGDRPRRPGRPDEAGDARDSASAGGPAG